MIGKKEAAKALLVILYMIALVLILNALGHCATTSSAKNSLGAVISDQNPYMYLAGAISQAPDAISIVDGNLNIRMKPLGMYMLYDESVLLCGRPAEKFEGINGDAMVLTYKRQASRIVQGVGCHELIRVDNMIPKKE